MSDIELFPLLFKTFFPTLMIHVAPAVEPLQSRFSFACRSEGRTTAERREGELKVESRKLFKCGKKYVRRTEKLIEKWAKRPIWVKLKIPA